ncbi:MAG: MarR family transcriptional regulator [Candidatus Pacebacteria bacterium]|nr:MarR family transcriptional regulator [Candidatus Paceibacterota bacterium]
MTRLVVTMSIKPTAEILGEQKVASLPINREAMALVSNLHRASSLIRQHFEALVLSTNGLHWSAFVTLWCLWIFGELPTHRLSQEVGIAKSSLSSILNDLEKRGFLVRRTPPEERRQCLVQLTAKGEQLLSDIFPRFNEEEAAILVGLTPSAMAVTTNLLRDLIAKLDEE